MLKVPGGCKYGSAFPLSKPAFCGKTFKRPTKLPHARRDHPSHSWEPQHHPLSNGHSFGEHHQLSCHLAHVGVLFSKFILDLSFCIENQTTCDLKCSNHDPLCLPKSWGRSWWGHTKGWMVFNAYSYPIQPSMHALARQFYFSASMGMRSLKIGSLFKSSRDVSTTCSSLKTQTTASKGKICLKPWLQLGYPK